jgi:citrate lyase subunit beta/citryl-CoA lyase
MTVPLRSLLFCPATVPKRVRKLPSLGADAVAIDIEDAVADSRKVGARNDVLAVIDEFADTRTYVRVNHPSTGLTEGDIKAIVHPNLDGIVLPKVEGPATVAAAAQWLGEAERERGMEAGRTRILVLVESGLGIHKAAESLAADDRVETAIFGYVDYMLDVGINVIDTSDDSEELLYARSSLVLAARVAGCRQPLDGPFIDIDDKERFLRQCSQGRALGFAGKMLIHPSQVELTHQGFRPPPEEVEQATRIVAAFDQAEAEGTAAIVVDGRLVDYPVAMRARRIVEAAS